MAQVTINSIKCNSTSEAGHDELYLICQADARFFFRYPTQLSDSIQMGAGTVWSPNLPLTFTHEVLVTLWDCDVSYVASLSTYLQSHDFEPGSGSGSITLTNPNGASYTINYTYGA